MKKVMIFFSAISVYLLILDVVNAADYIWPIGGDNASETYIEYGYEQRTYDTTSYDRLYNYAPFEQNYGSLSKCRGQSVCVENHYGVDITGVKGNTYSVVSVSDGKVVATSGDRFFNSGLNLIDRNQRQSTKDGGGYGNYIVIQEESTGRCYLYAHLKAGTINLRQNDKVTAGQVIAIMGSSGDSGHMHLHFEVRNDLKSVTKNFGGSLTVTTGFDNETVDPRNFIGYDAPAAEVVEPIVEPETQVEEEVGPEQSPIVKDSPATVSSVSYKDYITYKQIDIYFDKAVIVKEAPILNVSVGNETVQAKYLGLGDNGKKISYTVNYNQFDVMTSGNVVVNSIGGNILNKSDSSVSALVNVSSDVGELFAYKITELYTNIISKQVGDLNLDGVVNAKDAAILNSINAKRGAGNQLTEEEQEQYSRSDVNGDGIVNVKDASAILSYSASRGAGYDFEGLAKCDLSRDGVVDVTDYNILVNAISQGVADSMYDINTDGYVNNNDMIKFKEFMTKYGSR